MNEQTVSIVGLGALGVLYGQHLSEALGKDRVRVVVNEGRKKKYESDGVTLNGVSCDSITF
ncbi:MAG: hypothetical protein LRY37_00940 [Alkalibacterium thalassium]|nr:hypothetical protein [Alkalibacterium thalassium]